jgi:hypothetical protein
MATELQDEMNLILKTAGFGEQASLLAMHLSEIEDEAGATLDLLTTLRSHAYRGDKEATQEALAELAIALEHLLHHVHEALPGIQKELNIEPE